MTDAAALRSRRVVLPDGERPATIVVENGRIAAIRHYDSEPPPVDVVEVGDNALLPGLVDTHVHVNEPGRTEWEGYATATRAATAGGVTTIVDMPLNSLPPTLDPESLAVKTGAAADVVFADVGFWGGAVPGNLGRLKELHDAGVLGFKCFTTDPGVPEFSPLLWPQVHAALDELTAFDGLLLVHAEDAAVLAEAPSPGDSHASFVGSRPAAAEEHAVAELVELLRMSGGRAHVLHVSAAGTLAEIARASAAGVRITAETCPHYLTLTTASVTDTTAKCCPPIRDSANQQALWQGLADSTVGCVVSDHSPCPPELKRGGFDTAWGGVSSLQLGLPVVWTTARERGHGLVDVARWMATGPAELAGLPRKGKIAVGNDADLVELAPDEQWLIDPSTLWHRHPVTPYAERQVTGAVRRTWLRGKQVLDEPFGELIAREHT